MRFYEFTLCIILVKWTYKSSKLNAVIAVFNIFSQNMLAILLKKMKGQEDNKKVGDLNFKGLPNNLLVASIDLHLFNTEHGNISNGLNKLSLRLKSSP